MAEPKRKTKPKPQIRREDLPMTAQKKLDAAIRQHKHQLDLEFNERWRAKMKQYLNDVALPAYIQEMRNIAAMITFRPGIMDHATYMKLVRCLHPDVAMQGRNDETLRKRYQEAFQILTELKPRLLSEKENPTTFRKLPETFDELLKMRTKMQAERRAREHA